MISKILRKTVIGIMAAAMMMSVASVVTTNTANAATVGKSGDYKYVKYLNGVKIKEYTGKAKKVTVFTYKPKKNAKRKMGHRQPYTKVEISAINA